MDGRLAQPETGRWQARPRGGPAAPDRPGAPLGYARRSISVFTRPRKS